MTSIRPSNSRPNKWVMQIDTSNLLFDSKEHAELFESFIRYFTIRRSRSYESKFVVEFMGDKWLFETHLAACNYVHAKFLNSKLNRLSFDYEIVESEVEDYCSMFRASSTAVSCN